MSVCDDALVWKLEHDDVYSLRNAYILCVNIAGNQNRNGVPGNWHQIWQSKIAPKVKNLILPTRTRLNSHGVQFPTPCDVCNDGDEDSMHALFLFSRSVQCWYYSEEVS
jgi:hypothetical protein